MSRCRLELPGLPAPLEVTAEAAAAAAGRYLLAVQEAASLYRHLAACKGEDAFVTEVSMDETDTPQTPAELFFILAALAWEGVPAQTVAPRFSGRFNKGVDYVGDPDQFEREFAADVAVVAHARQAFGLPQTLKLSVHSGSDKFAIYPAINRVLHATGAGLHLKTAGTTWLEELVGLAAAGGDGLAVAREVYRSAHGRAEALIRPYAAVIAIDPARLPSPATVDGWSGEEFAGALRHDPACPLYNPHLRQLLHVGYKVAAEMGPRYLEALDAHRDVIARQVTTNILDRHLRRVFG